MIRYHQLLLAPGRIKRGMICAVLKLSGNYESMHGLLINRNTNPDCVDSSLRADKADGAGGEGWPGTLAEIFWNARRGKIRWIRILNKNL